MARACSDHDEWAVGVVPRHRPALAVPDLTTTVLPLTITGIAADTTLSGKSGKIGRRLVPIVTMFLGGLIGALLVTTGHRPLGTALVLLVAVVALSRATAGSRDPWTRKP